VSDPTQAVVVSDASSKQKSDELLTAGVRCVTVRVKSCLKQLGLPSLQTGNPGRQADRPVEESSRLNEDQDRLKARRSSHVTETDRGGARANFPLLGSSAC
jgi:hypothetical protein